MRLNKFKSLADHPWYRKQYTSLKKEEVAVIVNFIEASAHLSFGDYALAVERMFLDKPNKPKRWALLQELALVSNVKE